MRPLIQMCGMTKRYGTHVALSDVDFDVCPGEVHALMGENGAGKSTLMKLLAGSFDDYAGRVTVDGETVDLHTPAQARQNGIGMVYQELSLARPISIAENLLVGRLPRTAGILVDRAKVYEGAKQCLAEVGLDLDPDLTVDQISPHEAQLVEIAKVLGTDPRVLVFDEPTSSLSREETERLFAIIDRLKGKGLAIVYISHHLPEIFRIADRVTVLRDGKRIGTEAMGSVTPQTLVQMMVGQSIDTFYHRREPVLGDTRIRVRDLTRRGFFHQVSFEAKRGEILGLVGLNGAGRSELARSMCGLDPVHAGTVEIDGRPLARGSYAKAVARGLVYLTEDRKNDGLFLRLPITENIVAGLLRRHSHAGIYSSGHEPGVTAMVLEQLEVAVPSSDADAGNLSGGNQQKVLLGKWLATEPRVLILDEPSRGVDVKAKMKIHDAVSALADQGATILLISSDLPELVGLADRAIVIRQGRVIGEMRADEMTEESVLLAANGQGVITDA